MARDGEQLLAGRILVPESGQPGSPGWGLIPSSGQGSQEQESCGLSFEIK